jgi:hypothetical protein
LRMMPSPRGTATLGVVRGALDDQPAARDHSVIGA